MFYLSAKQDYFLTCGPINPNARTTLCVKNGNSLK
jgi:hypothetical protein